MRLEQLDGEVNIRLATRKKIVDATLGLVGSEITTRIEIMHELQSRNDYDGFSRVLQEMVGLDNLKRVLEERQQLQLSYTQPITMEVTDWNSPAELREKASILRDEQTNVTREIADCQTRITTNLAQIREKEEIIKFITDLNAESSDRHLLVDARAVPRLEQELTGLRTEVSVVRDCLGRLQIERAKLQEQSELLSAQAAKLERELFE